MHGKILSSVFFEDKVVTDTQTDKSTTDIAGIIIGCILIQMIMLQVQYLIQSYRSFPYTTLGYY